MKKTVDIICEALAGRIQDGEFDEQRRLPAERTLSQQFMTTRITLREALSQLENQGIIYRELRRGWFIAPPRMVYNPLHHSHFRAMAEEQGRNAETELIDAGMVMSSDGVAAQLGILPGADVIKICRLRRIDGRAVLYVENYLNPAWFPGLLEMDLAHSLTDLYLSQYGIRYGGVRFTVLPESLPKLAASRLHVAAGSPGLFITRINRDQYGRIIDCDHEYWRYDALCIAVSVGHGSE